MSKRAFLSLGRQRAQNLQDQAKPVQHFYASHYIEAFSTERRNHAQEGITIQGVLAGQTPSPVTVPGGMRHRGNQGEAVDVTSH
jgi:hypothetical protein